MTSALPNDAEKARAQLRGVPTSSAAAGQAYATLALADAITTAARTLGNALVEAARIRAGAGQR